MLNTKFISFFFLLLSLSSKAQNFKGQVLDKKDRTAISYAAMGISNKSVGTVADKEGFFQFSSDLVKVGDTLLVSCMGYLDLSIEMTTYIIKSKDLGIIQLKQAEIRLPEIELIRAKLTGVSKKIGNGEEISYNFSIGIGGEKGREMGTFFKYKSNKSGVLKNVVIGVSDCKVNQKLFRLNIYQLDGRSKMYNIIDKHSVYFHIKPEHIRIGVTIDLLEQGIEISGPFLISIEDIEGSDPLNPDVTVFNKDRKIKYPFLMRTGIGSRWDFVNTRNSGIAMIAEILY